MNFFNNIGRKTSEVTTKIARETKLRIKMSDNKNKISDIYEEIGKKVYEKHIREEDIDIETDLKEECKKIDELAKEIEEERMEILRLNQRKVCIYCDSEIDVSARFCQQCGEEQKEKPEEEKPQDEVKIQINLEQDESNEDE